MPPPPPVNPQRLSPTESRTLHFYHGMGVNVPYRPRPSATGNALEENIPCLKSPEKSANPRSKRYRIGETGILQV
ncbi:hypothetical protein PAHAL_2G157100 [Panicum hallii]|uniref:Uncharacterized protein n=1 Tax=Panicum hallii TaxID=206008 RepID=A0A2T8KP92_9POAL|nr:hypothetical protein PAHAL_2G157100 [Panicum hallii]